MSKQIFTTTVKEYDEKGRVVKETTTTSEYDYTPATTGGIYWPQNPQWYWQAGTYKATIQ